MSSKRNKIQNLVSVPANDYHLRDVDAVYQRVLKLEALIGRLEARIARLERKGLQHDE